MDLEQIENQYHLFWGDLAFWFPDGLMNIDLNVLSNLDLLNHFHLGESSLPYTFSILETVEKITLFNEKFVIWIVPYRSDLSPVTYVLVTRFSGQLLHPEVVFSAAGVYNSSRLVLRILEKLLHEVEETEMELKKLNKHPLL
jgi:hypothetical protein